MGIQKNSSVFILKLIVFISIVIGVLYLFILPYAPDIGYDSRYTNSLKKLKSQPYDILFFGNSYVFTSYDPLIIKENLGLDALHLNVGAQRLEASLIIANEVIENQNVKYIFFDISGSSLNKPKIENEDSWQYQTKGLQEIPLSIEKALHVSNFYPINIYPEYYSTALSKKLGRAFRLNNLKKYSVKKDQKSYKTSEKTVYYSYNGFIANKQKPVEKAKFDKSFHLKPNLNGYNDLDTRWGEDLCKLMDSFLKKTAAKRINVVLINSLKLYPTNYESEVINEFTRKYKHVRFLDLNMKKDKYSLDENSFYNSTHINYQGSIEVTHRLVDSISQWFNLEKRKMKHYSLGGFNLINYSYKLNSQEDRFIKLEFDSIPSSVVKDQLAISLFGNETSESLNLVIDKKEIIKSKSSTILIKRLESKLTEKDLDSLTLKFHKVYDTLKPSSVTIIHEELED